MLDASLWFWIAPAVLFFWAVGAYNRLVRLRSRVVKAFAALDEQLVRQIVWMKGCLPEPMRDDLQTMPAPDLQDPVTAAWTRLHGASEQLAVALANARAQPTDISAMSGLVLAHEAMRTAWTGVLATAISDGAVPSSERLQARWMRLLHQSMPLRTAFNEAVQHYNHGIAQFPAWIISRAFGFRAAGTLTRLADPR